MEWLNVEVLWGIFRASLVLVAGLVVARVLSRLIAATASKQVKQHSTMLARRATYYIVFTLFLLMALHQLGFKLSVLLGAAGIVSVAVGFASQTSASNLISGLFLVAENPFSIGDVISVGSTTGEVISIDLLSVKLRTFDNLFVRIPNETLIKSEVKTLTKFDIRRVDLKLGVAYKEDLERVRTILLELADKHPLCLREPAPLFIFLGFGESSLDIQFSVWGARENFLELRTTMYLWIKDALDQAGIEIPFPHRTLYVGSETGPFPISTSHYESKVSDSQ